ncbi:21283_t:CDS:1 [Dentiscutata erythropus]|uniref:21283_t:CDS:1 n=1 Tax=Dentiscutata erythropus TaxID=1348616 RepID=A0A9N9F6Y5_9GLOM|nr:21283_t:CDS:1 [Dentiscutata erythropus]
MLTTSIDNMEISWPTKKTRTTENDTALIDDPQVTLTHLSTMTINLNKPKENVASLVQESMTSLPETNTTNVGKGNTNSHADRQIYLSTDNSSTIIEIQQLGKAPELTLQPNGHPINIKQTDDKDMDTRSNTTIESLSRISYSKAVKKNIFTSNKKKDDVSLV